MAALTYDDQAVARDLPALIAVMLASGLRLGEACAVLWRCVDLQAGTLEVEATVVRIKGKGLLRKATKTTAGRRILRLPKWSVEMLRERSRAVSATPDTPVFPTLTGKLRDPSNTAADLRDAFEKAGFGWPPAMCSAKRQQASSMPAALPLARSPTNSATPGHRSPWTATWAAVSPPTALRPSSRPWHDLGPLQLPQRRHRAKQGRPTGTRKVIRSSGSSGAGRDARPRRWATKRGEARGPRRLEWAAQVRQRRRRRSARAARSPVATSPTPPLSAAPAGQPARPTSGSATRTPAAGQNSPAPTRRDDSNIAMWGHPLARRTMHGQRWVRTEGDDRCDAPEVRSPFDAIDKRTARGRRDRWLHQLASIVVQGSRGSWLCPSLMISHSRAILAPTYQTAR